MYLKTFDQVTLTTHHSKTLYFSPISLNPVLVENHNNYKFNFHSSIESVLLIWITEDTIKIRHPLRNVFLNLDLEPVDEERAAIFRIIEPNLTNDIIKCYIQCPNGKFIWIDKKWNGWKLKNDSTNKGEWEVITIKKC